MHFSFHIKIYSNFAADNKLNGKIIDKIIETENNFLCAIFEEVNE